LSLTFELIQMFVSGQECILNSILCVGCVAQLSIGASVEPRQVARQNVLHFAASIFANIDIHVWFASHGLCRLHGSFSSRYDNRKARRLPIGRLVIYLPVFGEMNQLKLAVAHEETRIGRLQSSGGGHYVSPHADNSGLRRGLPIS
jgi:hypothetical protein